MLKRIFLFALLLVGIAFWLPRFLYPQSAPWTPIAPGVELRDFHTSPPTGSVHVIAFRTRAKRVHLAVGTTLDAPAWRRRERAIAAVNGGFFDAGGSALGLRISNGKRTSRIRNADWGIFYVRGGKAHIVHTDDFKMQKGITDAVQCGPRLVVNGRLVKLKDQWARRTALGIQRNGDVIVAISDGEIGFRDWAALWSASGGFNCPDAMGMDGGGSTQLSLRTATRSLEIEGYTKVPDAIVIR